MKIIETIEFYKFLTNFTNIYYLTMVRSREINKSWCFQVNSIFSGFTCKIIKRAKTFRMKLPDRLNHSLIGHSSPLLPQNPKSITVSYSPPY